MKKKKLPKYEIVLEGEKLGVSFVSVVQNPAIEINWQTFSSQETDFSFASVSNEKRMLAGPLIVPDLMIYRKGEDGKEYEVYFSKQTIELAIKKFAKSLNGLNVNEEHSETSVPGFIVESWLVSGESDKSKTMGFSLPEGSWFAIIHIEDEGYWNEMVKTNKVRGFSVEGLMSMQQKQTLSMEKFAKIDTVDGVLIYTKSESEMMSVGEEVFTMNGETEEVVADGEYMLSTGMTMVVVEGKIFEIKEKVEEEEMAEVAPIEVATEPVQVDIEAIRTEFNAALIDLATRLSAVEATLAEEKDKNAEMNDKVEKMSKFQSESPKKTVNSMPAKKEVTLSTDKVASTNSKLSAVEAIAAYRGN